MKPANLKAKVKTLNVGVMLKHFGQNILPNIHLAQKTLSSGKCSNQYSSAKVVLEKQLIVVQVEEGLGFSKLK